MNFTQFHEVFLHQVVVRCKRANEPKYANIDKTRLDGSFMSKQCLQCDIQSKTTFRTLCCHRRHVFPMIITVWTLMSLIQRIKHFTMHVVTKRKLTLF